MADVILDLQTQLHTLTTSLRASFATSMPLATQCFPLENATVDVAVDGLQLQTQVIVLLEKPPIPPSTNNIQAGIVRAGQGVVVTCDIEAGIAPSFDFDIEAGVAEDAITPPVDPLAAYLGQSVLMLQWSPPVTGTPQAIEVHAAFAEGGPYVFLGEFPGTSTKATLSNVPIGTILYFRLRARRVTGLQSSFVQAKKATLSHPTVNMKVEAISGSILNAGSLFMSMDAPSGRAVVIQCPEETVIE